MADRFPNLRTCRLWGWNHILQITNIINLHMDFTNSKKDDLYQWVCNNLHIKGMDELCKQITRDGKVNYNRDKDGFFFQTQITQQLAESKRYDITMVEGKGFGHDIDIELDRHVWIQTWFGGNVVGHLLDQKIARSNSSPVLYYQRTCLDKDFDVLEHKLDQIGRSALGCDMFEPTMYILDEQHALWPQTVRYQYTMPMPSIKSDDHPVKILVSMSSTRLPLHFPPEWYHHLKDGVIIELRGDFGYAGNLRGIATLHRTNKQWDVVAKDIVDALGFRYVESFNSLGTDRSSVCFGGVPTDAWQSSYLNTASQRILLQPKVMAISLKSDFVAGYFVDSGYEASPKSVRNYINDELRHNVSRVIWADVEQSAQNISFTLDADHPESIDRIISDQNMAKNSQPGLYNPYEGKIDRNKTNAFDSTVIDVECNDLEQSHVVELLNGIKSKSNKRPDLFLGDPIALLQMIELGRSCDCLEEVVIWCDKTSVLIPLFMRIPVWNDCVRGPNKRGCIYAIKWEDELGVPTGLRMLESSFHENEMWRCGSSNDCITYVVGETAVDPRACGKIMNIRC